MNKSPLLPSNRKFGWLFAGIFSIAAIYFYLKQLTRSTTISLFLAVLFALITICRPSTFAPLNRAWFSLSLFLGSVISPIVLSIIFFALIVPVALITRLFSRDVLLLKKRQVSTYWIDKEAIEPESFKNQF